MSELAEKAGKYVEELFASKLGSDIVFHNIDHIRRVRKHCLAIADGEGVSPAERDVLEIAAWFHDAGFVEDATTHELQGKNMAESWLRENGASEAMVHQVGRLILSTSMTHQAQDHLEEIIRDADVSHLGSDYYQEMQQLLRKEIASTREVKMSDLEWARINQSFFEKHKYHTQTARQLFDEQKAVNLNEIKAMADELENQQGEQSPAKMDSDAGTGNEPALVSETSPQEAEIKKGSGGKKGKKKKPARPEKGIETMFRVALRNHVQLSRLADNKANIMLSINAIVISVVLTSLLPKLDTNPFLVWPTLVLLSVCILSIIFATLSTIPSVTKGDPSREEIEKKNVNLIFFGNFHSMSLKDFDWGMRYMMEDSEYLYGSLIKDLYFLGKVLHKKYKYLRITYVVFMIGIIISVIAFVISLSLMNGAAI